MKPAILLALIVSSVMMGQVVNPPGGSGSTAPSAVTVTLAASNSTAYVKARANTICSGTADEVCINNAIALCPNSQTSIPGCEVVLSPGVYNTAGPVVIDNDDVTLRGENRCMWGGYLGQWYDASKNAGAIGLGCGQIRATASGFNLIELRCLIPGGTGADTDRHRGISIERLYLVGNNYTDAGIYSTCNDDNVLISENIIQKTLKGVNANFDAPIIRDNSIQDIAGDAITITGGFVPRITANLLWDFGGVGITTNATGGVITSNTIGDCANGIVLTNSFNSVVGNRISNCNLGLTLGSGIRGTTITGNVWDSALPGNNNYISLSNGDGTVFSSNTVDSFTNAETGYALIALGTKTLITSNVFGGAWASGAAVPISYGSNVQANNLYNYNPSTTTLVAQYRASDITGISSGNPITTWPDASGHGYTLTVGAGTPLYENPSLINSGPGVRLSVAQLKNVSAVLTVTNQQTIFVVFRVTSTPASFQDLVAGCSSCINSSIDASGNIAAYGGSVASSSLAVAANTTYVVEYVLSGANTRYSLNGTRATGLNPGTNTWGTEVYVGSRAVGGENFAGDIAEVRVYSGAMDMQAAATLGASLCTSYGATCSTNW